MTSNQSDSEQVLTEKITCDTETFGTIWGTLLIISACSVVHWIIFAVVLKRFYWKRVDIKLTSTGWGSLDRFKPVSVAECLKAIERNSRRNFLREAIEIEGRILGAGNFGIVHSAMLRIDTLHPKFNEYQQQPLIREEEMRDDGRIVCCVKVARHVTRRSWREMLYDISLVFTVMDSEERWKDRIVAYFGYHMCTKCPFAGIVMRKYDETLEEYTIKMRNGYVTNDWLENSQNVDLTSGYSSRGGNLLTDTDLVDILMNVAKGMICLANLNIVHGDLTPSAILCNQVPQDRVEVHIGDFGQAKIFDPDLGYVDQRHIFLRPPEDIYHTIPSEKTDVWAFGMLVMHIFDLCNHINDPYQGQAPAKRDNETPNHHLERHLAYLNQGGRAPISPNTPNGAVELINQCWQTRPEDRPTFQEILERLREIQQQVNFVNL